MNSSRLEIIRPDDWHLHLRDGDALASVVGHTAAQFARAIVMPNLKPPVATVAQAQAYRQRILDCLPAGARFQPLMTLYLTEDTTPEEIALAKASDSVFAVKYYPAGATTNSQSGVRELSRVYAVLEAMEKHALPLLLHGEVTDPSIDIFDRERVFIERHLLPLQARFPGLRMVLEHITTKDAVEFVTGAPDHVAATITAHHLLLNRNALFEGGIRPHNYCAPILKRETHRAALLQAATSGAKLRRPRAAVPGSTPHMPRSSCMRKPSSRPVDWTGWRPSPASMARTSIGCRATRIASCWSARRGPCRPAIRWPPRPACRCVRAKRWRGRWCRTTADLPIASQPRTGNGRALQRPRRCCFAARFLRKKTLQ
jgi:dihydroorotase (homodimeric type)